MVKNYETDFSHAMNKCDKDKPLLLGQETDYPQHYNAGLLQPIARSLSRAHLFKGEAAFVGVDIWTAYELSWLTSAGKPCVAIAEFVFPCNSEAIIESKSFKYYLNSLNQHRFENRASVKATLSKDLSCACGAGVQVELFDIDSYTRGSVLCGENIDSCDVANYAYTPKPELLAFSQTAVENARLYSHLLKSNCPVTGQPDWATLWLEYSGKRLLPESLLAYVVSFRSHQDFHENCVERIFCDLLATGKVSSLAVYARYTRRGGLDINPYRATRDREAVPRQELLKGRTARQ